MDGLIENPDGSLIQEPAGVGFIRYPPLTDEIPCEVIDPLFLAQAAVASIIGGMRAWVYDGDAVVLAQRRRVAMVRIARVNFDWPKSEFDLEGDGDGDRPLSVTIVEGGGKTRIDDDIGGGHFLNGTRIDEDTVAETLGTATVDLELHCTCTHTDERRAVRSLFLRAFIAEPLQEAHGRAVVAPIDNLLRSVSLTLESVTNQDSPQDAQENLRMVTCYLQAEVPVISLTQKPATMDPRLAASLV